LDIVDEEIFIDWHSKVSKKYVSKELVNEIHAKSHNFVQWLKEAEEKEDDVEVSTQLSIGFKIESKAKTTCVMYNQNSNILGLMFFRFSRLMIALGFPASSCNESLHPQQET